jgi:hypothetical protein
VSQYEEQMERYLTSISCFFSEDASLVFYDYHLIGVLPLYE